MIPVIIGFAALFLAGCGSDDPPPQLPCLPPPTGNAGHGGTAGHAGSGGTAGHAGTSGAGGAASHAGAGGASGHAGTSGAGGSAGHAGSAGTAGHAGMSGTGGTAGHAGTSGSAGKGGMMKKIFHLPPGSHPVEIEEAQEESRTFGLFRLFDSPREVAKVGIGSLPNLEETQIQSQSPALVCTSENDLG